MLSQVIVIVRFYTVVDFPEAKAYKGHPLRLNLRSFFIGLLIQILTFLPLLSLMVGAAIVAYVLLRGIL